MRYLLDSREDPLRLTIFSAGDGRARRPRRRTRPPLGEGRPRRLGSDRLPQSPHRRCPAGMASRLRRLTYRENIGRVKVFRTWLWPLPNRKAHERMRNYASFCCLRGTARPDHSASRRDHRHLAATSRRALRLVARLLPAGPLRLRSTRPLAGIAGRGRRWRRGLSAHHALGGDREFLVPARRPHRRRDPCVQGTSDPPLARPRGKNCSRRKRRRDRSVLARSPRRRPGTAPANSAPKENFWSATSAPWAWPTDWKRCSTPPPNCSIKIRTCCFCSSAKARKKSASKLWRNPRPGQRPLSRSAAPRENPRLHLRFRCLPGPSEEDRCLQDRDSHQDARVHVLRPPRDSGRRRSGAADCRRSRSRTRDRARKLRSTGAGNHPAGRESRTRRNTGTKGKGIHPAEFLARPDRGEIHQILHNACDRVARKWSN